MSLLNDYRKVLNYKLGKGKTTIEDVNDVLLSSHYHNKYGEYGVDNFLMFYANEVKKQLTKDQEKFIVKLPKSVKKM